ncbi:hypothetical protein ED733_005183 [Metarhizium rileyi]|uniref:Pentatricopeptide repeat domain-containing protein n=1 Tax=Metarhizium rileyi (strain RCEF 4871) TaxID=1649241 RepID=A0A5C6GAF2_METRR|nr:hypothetical protein ED733_005183 [Metarhizium rileyi]
MQSNLAALYVACADKQLYDDIIPVLFAAGRSKLARAWRKKLLAYQDFPRTSKSKPFVQFLARFYPTILLTPEELEIGGLMSNSFDAQNSRPKNTETEVNKGQFSDAIVARWFASTWTSVEFAIKLAQTLGLRTIGPRSLQSLALRESDSRTVASRVAQIEKLDIAISNQVYCKALVHFAKHEKDALLTSLLSCDVHPDEFEDIETRQMLMASSVREQDWQMERLLQGIEWAIEHDPVACKLHALLDRELLKRKLDNARQVVQRMEALKVNMSQESALQLLEGTFLGLGKHPAGKIRQTKESSRHDFEALLSRALDVTRRVALHDVAIPLRFWSLLFYNLGRLGRFAELEQLSLEVVQLYTPPLGGLIPIHAADLPQSDINTGNEGDTIRCRFAPPIAEKISRHNCSSQHDQSWSNVRRCVEVPTSRQSDDEEALPVNRKLASGSESVVKDQRADRSIERELDLALAKENSKEYIPADLPFSHRKHPVQRLFDAHLQRSIVRWGFDQTLKTKPNAIALVDPPTFNVSSFDVASGVRLLALLRDRGVLIDPHILRTTIVTRIALGHMPSRQRDRSRDRHELSVEYMKALFDEAWGFEILPSPPEISRQIENQKPRLWGRYFNLFGQSFDKG